MEKCGDKMPTIDDNDSVGECDNDNIDTDGVMVVFCFGPHPIVVTDNIVKRRNV